MRILQANKFHYLKGGAERYFFELTKILTRNGDAVVPFAMRSEKNLPSHYDRFFVSEVKTDRVRFDREGLRTAKRMLWSFEAAKKFSGLLAAFPPEIIHVHNIYHQISPSILDVAQKRKIPVVMTVHDYHVISPNYGMFDRGEIVEPSVKHPYWDTFHRRLIGGSFAKSALSAFEGWLHDVLDAYGWVSTFIAPSEFVRQKLLAYGIPESKIEVVPHFIDLEGRAPRFESEARVAFVGRLSEEKGVDVLLRAMKEVRHLTCAIIGDGPEKQKLHALAEELKLDNVEFLGALHNEELEREIARAKAIIIPSQSYETFGLTALEAYAWGKPVIASRIGALPEVVREGETGLLFDPKEPKELAAHLSWLQGNFARVDAMGRAGRHLAETEYNPGLHLGRIHRIYKEALKK
jgi:glycosyltransferase involved in cell wall biosynthesis